MRYLYLPKNPIVVFLLGVLCSSVVLAGVAGMLSANLIGPAATEVENYTVVITDTITENEEENDTVVLNFSADFADGYDENAVIDGLHIEVVYPLGVTPLEPTITTNSETGVLFDPVQFVELPNGKYRASITFKDLDSSVEDENYYDFAFEYENFSTHTLEISGEVLMESMSVIELDPIDYLLTTEEPEEESDEDEPEEELEEEPGDGGRSGTGGRVFDDFLDEEPELEDTGGQFVCKDKSYGPEDHPFKDLDGHYAESQIAAMYDLGYVVGYGSEIGRVFRPDQEITRAEYLKVVMEAVGCYELDRSLVTLYPDVMMYAWYRPYITTASNLGIVEGYFDGYFRPERSVTRAEALKILIKVASIDMVDGTGDLFSDVNSYDWYVDVVETAYYYKIAQGFEDNTFAPNENITRAEAAVILMNADCGEGFQCGNVELSAFNLDGIF